MEREDRVRRQSCGIYSRVRMAGVEFGIFYQSPRAPDRNSRLLVRVTRCDQQGASRMRYRGATSRDHGELYLAERRRHPGEHRKEIRIGLATRCSKVNR